VEEVEEEEGGGVTVAKNPLPYFSLFSPPAPFLLLLLLLPPPPPPPLLLLLLLPHLSRCNHEEVEVLIPPRLLLPLLQFLGWNNLPEVLT